MAESRLNIKLMVQNLNALKKLGSKVKNLGRQMKSSFNQGTRAIKNTNRAVEQNGRFLSQSAERLGFMAFQFVFLQGIASRALGSIRMLFQQVFEGGIENIDGMVRAISQSGIDISRSTEDSRMAMDLLNDAILNLGGGDTIHNIQEVAEAMKDIGKATAFTGTELQKATKLIGVTQQVLRLMTIEEINVEEAAIGLVKTMKNFNLELGEAKRATDALIRVNQNSAITLDQLIRAFGFSAQQAKKFGLDIEDTAAILGILGDRLGQGAGAAGRNFDILLRNLRTNAFKAEEALGAFGQTLFKTVNGRAQMKDFTGVLDALRAAFKKAGPAAGALRIQLEKQLGLTSRATRALDILLSVTKEEIAASQEFARTGDVANLDEIFANDPAGQFARLKNSIEALKVLFVGSFAPAITLASTTMQDLVRTNDVQEFITTLGKGLAQDVIPPIRIAAQVFAVFAKFLKKNTALVQTLARAMLIFVGVLVAMFIIGIVGTLVAAMGSSMLKLAGIVGITTATMKLLLVNILRLVAGFLAIAFIVIGVRNLFKTLVDGFQKGEEGIVAISLLLIGLGLALAFAVGNVPGLIIALAAIGATFGLIFGKKLLDDGAFTDAGKAIDDFGKEFTNILSGLNLDALGEFTDGLVAGITGAFKEAGMAATEFFVGLDKDFHDALDATIKAANQFGEDIAKEIGAALKDTFVALLDFVKWIGEAIENARASIVKKGEEIGTAITEGIQKKLTSSIGTLATLFFGTTGFTANIVAETLDPENQGTETIDFAKVFIDKVTSVFDEIIAVVSAFKPRFALLGTLGPGGVSLALGGAKDDELAKLIKETIKGRRNVVVEPKKVKEPKGVTTVLGDFKDPFGQFQDIGLSLNQLFIDAGMEHVLADFTAKIDATDLSGMRTFDQASLSVAGTLLGLSDVQLQLIGFTRAEIQEQIQLAQTRSGLSDATVKAILETKATSFASRFMSEQINVEALTIKQLIENQLIMDKQTALNTAAMANFVGSLEKSTNFAKKFGDGLDADEVFGEVIGLTDNLKISVQKAGEDFQTVVFNSAEDFDTAVQEGAIKLGKSAVVASKDIKNISVAAKSFAQQIASLSLSELDAAIDLIDLGKSIEIDAGTVDLDDISNFFKVPVQQALRDFDLSVVAAIFDGLGEVTQSNSFQMLELVGAVQGLTEAELQQLGITQAEITALIARVATIQQLSDADVALVLSTNSTAGEMGTLKQRLADVTSAQSNLKTGTEGLTLTFGPLKLTLVQVDTALQGLKDKAIETTLSLGTGAGQVVKTGDGDFKVTLKEDISVTAGIINDEGKKLATSMGGITRESDAMAARIKAEADRVAEQFAGLFAKINANPFATTGGFEQREVTDPETGEKIMENIIPQEFVSAEALAIRDKMLQDFQDAGFGLAQSSLDAQATMATVTAELTTITDAATGISEHTIKLTESIALQEAAIGEGKTTSEDFNFTMGELNTVVSGTLPIIKESGVQIKKFAETQTEKLQTELLGIGIQNEQNALVRKIVTKGEQLIALIATEIVLNDARNTLMAKLNEIIKSGVTTRLETFATALIETNTKINSLNVAISSAIAALNALAARAASVNLSVGGGGGGGGGNTSSGGTPAGGDTTGQDNASAPSTTEGKKSGRRRSPTEGAAKGGLVDVPTNLIVGEAGPELIIPLDRLEEFMKPKLEQMIKPQIELVASTINQPRQQPTLPPDITVESPDVIVNIDTPKHPDIKIPTIKSPEMPDVKVPEIKSPEIPNINVPKIETPEPLESPTIADIVIESPRTEGRSFVKGEDQPEIPDIGIPRIDAPLIPPIDIPQIEPPTIPQIIIPKIESPNVEVPKMDIPKIEVSPTEIPPPIKTEEPVETNITNEFNITVEGNAAKEEIDELTDRISEIINSNIKGKSTLRIV